MKAEQQIEGLRADTIKAFAESNYSRRRFLRDTAVVVGAAQFGVAGLAGAQSGPLPLPTQPASAEVVSPMEPIRQIHTDVLDIGYYEAGPSDGSVVLLLHGYPYDIHSYVEVAPILAARGCRVIVPYSRGFGSTRFLDASTPRSGEQAAIGADVIALMDALKIPSAVLAGYDWGGRAACIAAALWPERCKGLVSVNSYNIQDISKAMTPITATMESLLWYQYYFQFERGRAGLIANRRSIARVTWSQMSPAWHPDDATFERTAKAFDNPDYVEVVIHSYRHRMGLAPTYPPYEEIERKLAAQPVITVPAITLDGEADGYFPAGDGSASSSKFSGPRIHRRIPGAGHNLPQEAPVAFAEAVTQLMKAG